MKDSVNKFFRLACVNIDRTDDLLKEIETELASTIKDLEGIQASPEHAGYVVVLKQRLMAATELRQQVFDSIQPLTSKILELINDVGAEEEYWAALKE